MARHEPAFGIGCGPAVPALVTTRSPAAAVPLADLASRHVRVPEDVEEALATLTGQSLTGGGLWRTWLYGPGLEHLRTGVVQPQSQGPR